MTLQSSSSSPHNSLDHTILIPLSPKRTRSSDTLSINRTFSHDSTDTTSSKPTSSAVKSAGVATANQMAVAWNINDTKALSNKFQTTAHSHMHDEGQEIIYRSLGAHDLV